MSTALSIGGAVLAFGLMIFIHELGHFMAAKWAGMQVNDFSIGMGPAIWEHKKGDTTYALRLDRKSVV